MSELPQGWAETTLGEITEHKSGNSKLIKGKLLSECVPGSYPAFSATGQDVWHVDHEHEGEAIIISAVGARCGKCFVADGKWSAIANTHIVWPSESVLDRNFLWYLINDEDFWIKGGSAQPFVKVTSTFAQQFLLPPLLEQRRIVAKLDSLFIRTKTAREELARIPLLVEHYKRAILEKAFGGELTADWRAERGLAANWVPRSGANLFKWGSGKFLPQKKQIAGGIPVYGGNGITGEHNDALITFPTLVIGRVGAQCGNVHTTKGAAWITDNAIYASQISDDIILDYAYWVFENANLNANAGGSGQPFVNQTTLNEVEILLPQAAEQEEIVRRVQLAQAVIGQVESDRAQATHLLDHLDQGLLAKAFRGELVPQYPTDEPADKLLARIRAERAGKAKPQRGRRKG